MSNKQPFPCEAAGKWSSETPVILSASDAVVASAPASKSEGPTQDNRAPGVCGKIPGESRRNRTRLQTIEDGGHYRMTYNEI